MKQFKKKTVSNGKFICWNKINLPQMKYGYCIFTINKEKIVDEGCVLIIGSSSREESNDLSDNKYHPSSVLVLCVVVIKNPHRKKGWRWGKQHHSALHYTKHNTVTGTT